MSGSKIRRTLDGLIVVVAVVFGLALFFGIGLAGWYVTRSLHYRLSYKSMVEQTVREMVKSDALVGYDGQKVEKDADHHRD